MKERLGRHWIKIVVVLAVVGLGVLGRLKELERPPSALRDDGPLMVLPRPTAVDMSPGSLPDRSGGKKIGRKLIAVSLEPSDAEVQELVANHELEEWFGVYSMGQKVGFGRMVMRPSRAGEPGGYFIALDMVMRSSAEGEVDVFRNESVWRYAASKPFALFVLETREASEAGVVERRFSFSADGGRLETVTDGGPPEVRQIAATRETVAASFACDPGRVNVGDKAENIAFDETLLKDVVWQTTIQSLGRRTLDGVEVPIAVVRSYAPHDQSSYVEETTEGGVMLSVSMGDGFQMKTESRHRAAQNIGSMDAIHDGVLVKQALGDPGKVRSLSLILSAGKNFRPPDAPNQRVTKLGEGRFRLDLTATAGASVEPGEADEFKKPSATVDSDHPTITRAAASVLAGVESDARKVQALVKYVDRTVTDSYSSNLATASQVLSRQTGDCTEHTMLFLALARAQGIAAREVSGLVYSSDNEKRFVWHAWAEVALNGRWVPVDPTFGEVRANATHIKLGSERDARWLSIGKLAIDVLE